MLKIIKHSWWWCTVIRDAYYKRWTHKHWVFDSLHVAHKHTQPHTFTSVLCSLRLREFRVLNVSVHLMHTSTQDQQKQVKNYSSPALMPKNTLNSHCRILQSSSKQMSEAAAESATIRLWRLKDQVIQQGIRAVFILYSVVIISYWSFRRRYGGDGVTTPQPVMISDPRGSLPSQLICDKRN